MTVIRSLSAGKMIMFLSFLKLRSSVFHCLNSGKNSGEDGILAENYKRLPLVTQSPHNLSRLIRETQKYPSDRNISVLFLFSKRVTRPCGNYRGTGRKSYGPSWTELLRCIETCIHSIKYLFVGSWNTDRNSNALPTYATSTITLCLI